jgi:hypothetical protein
MAARPNPVCSRPSRSLARSSRPAARTVAPILITGPREAAARGHPRQQVDQSDRACRAMRSVTSGASRAMILEVPPLRPRHAAISTARCGRTRVARQSETSLMSFLPTFGQHASDTPSGHWGEDGSHTRLREGPGAAMEIAPTPAGGTAAGEVARRMLRRAIRMLLVSPSTWLMAALAARHRAGTCSAQAPRELPPCFAGLLAQRVERRTRPSCSSQTTSGATCVPSDVSRSTA